MKKNLKRLLFIFIACFLFVIKVDAKEKIKLYFFHGDGCPHCSEEEKFLKKIQKKYKDVEIVKYEVWYQKKNQELLEKVNKRFDLKTSGVPVTIIGSTSFVGYMDSYQYQIKRAIEYYLDCEKDYQDVVLKIKNGTYQEKKVEDPFLVQEEKLKGQTTVKIPLIGKIDLKNVSVGVAAFVIGLVDGFNPCAMWILLFLISMLIGMKNRKRMWALGISFLVTSALVYMIIMLSFFNVIISVTTSMILRNIVAFIAIIGAFLNLHSFRKSKGSGCDIVDSKKRKKIFSKIKKFTKEKSFILALLGVIGLAVSVNLVELACSAGLPLVFTQILALNKLTGMQSLFYTLIYIFFFLLDDLIVFTVAMVTTKITGISTKYHQYSHLIGGFIMLIVGVLLLFKPEWLMFNFH